MMEKNDIPFGIDLGYTKTCGAVWWNEKTEVVVNDLGSRTTPSYYYFDGIESCVGKSAKDKNGTNPRNVYYDSKRILAQKATDPLIKKFKAQWDFELEGNQAKGNLCEYIVNEITKPLSPVVVSGEILKSIIDIAEKRFSQKLTKAVITVPAYFSTEQKKATQEAAKYANLDVIRIITEPTAAAIAYGLEQRKYMDGEKLFVFDLGDGTFDATIMSVSKNCFTSLVVRGVFNLGGRHFDHLIFEWMKQKLSAEDVKNLNEKKKFKMMLQAQAVKEALTSSQETLVTLSDIFGTAESHILKRCEFEEISKTLLNKIESECLTALKSKNLKAKDIDHVLFVGGSTRMPMVAKMLKNIFSDETKFLKVVNPDEVVAVGAAMYAAACMKASKRPEILEINIVEVLPMSIGVEITDGEFKPVLSANTELPCESSFELTTSEDNQRSSIIPIYGGERLLAGKNDLIMDVKLEGLPKKRAEKVKATLGLEVDGNAILKATAKGEGKEVTKQVNYKEQITQKGTNLCNAPSNSSNMKLCASVDKKNVNLEKFINRHYGHGISAFQQTMNNIVLVNLNCWSIPFLINAFQTYYTFIYDNVNNRIPDFFIKSSLSDSITPTNWFTLAKRLGTNKIFDEKNIALPQNLTTFVTYSKNNFLITSVIDFFSASHSMCSTINWIQNIKQVDAICLVVEINGESNYEKTIIRHLSYFSNKDLERIVLFIIHNASNVIPITLRITVAVAEYYKERKAVFKNGYDNIFIFDNDAYKHLLDEPKSLQDMNESLLKTWYHTVLEFLRFLKRPAVKQKYFIIVDDL